MIINTPTVTANTAEVKTWTGCYILYVDVITYPRPKLNTGFATVLLIYFFFRKVPVGVDELDSTAQLSSFITRDTTVRLIHYLWIFLNINMYSVSNAFESFHLLTASSVMLR